MMNTVCLLSQSKHLIKSRPLVVKILLHLKAGMSDYLQNFVTGYGISFERNKRDPEAFERAAAQWTEIEDELNLVEHDDSVSIFCGAKNNGKSSLVRHIANAYNKPKKQAHHLTNGLSQQRNDRYVYYIDFDPGQPEMTTPGMISAHIIKYNEQPLISPTYLNVNQHQSLVKSCVGGLNMSVNPRIYIENCRFVFEKVMEHRKQQTHHRPILINTMGFIRGVGLSMLFDLIKICRPNNLVVLNIPEDPMRIIHADLTPSGVNEVRPSFYQEDIYKPTKTNYRLIVHDLQFAFPDSSSVATKNRTALQLAYFAYVPEAIYKPILQIDPKWISLEAVNIHCVSSYPLKAATVLEILNQSWVHLVKLRQSPARKEVVRIEHLEERESGTLCNMVDDIGGNLLLGCGIVSALDLEHKKISIITPLDQKLLDNDIDCIIKPLSLQVPREIMLQNN